MRKKFWVTACFLCFATSGFSLELSDQKEIQAVIADSTRAWNISGGRGYGEGYTEDADFVNIIGMHFSGNKLIEKRHVHILETFLKDSKFEVNTVQLREIQPNIVMAFVNWTVHGFRTPGSDPNLMGTVRSGIFSHVFVKDQGKWKIAASQNTLLPS